MRSETMQVNVSRMPLCCGIKTTMFYVSLNKERTLTWLIGVDLARRYVQALNGWSSGPHAQQLSCHIQTPPPKKKNNKQTNKQKKTKKQTKQNKTKQKKQKTKKNKAKQKQKQQQQNKTKQNKNNNNNNNNKTNQQEKTFHCITSPGMKIS